MKLPVADNKVTKEIEKLKAKAWELVKKDKKDLNVYFPKGSKYIFTLHIEPDGREWLQTTPIPY